jgi:hypothetical protein
MGAERSANEKIGEDDRDRRTIEVATARVSNFPTNGPIGGPAGGPCDLHSQRTHMSVRASIQRAMLMLQAVKCS